MSDLNNYMADEIKISIGNQPDSYYTGDSPEATRRQITRLAMQMNMLSQQVWQLATGQDVPAPARMALGTVSSFSSMASQAAILPSQFAGNALQMFSGVLGLVGIGMAGYNFGKMLKEQLTAMTLESVFASAGVESWGEVDPGLRIFTRMEVKNGKTTFYSD